MRLAGLRLRLAALGLQARSAALRLGGAALGLRLRLAALGIQARSARLRLGGACACLRLDSLRLVPSTQRSRKIIRGCACQALRLLRLLRWLRSDKHCAQKAALGLRLRLLRSALGCA